MTLESGSHRMVYVLPNDTSGLLLSHGPVKRFRLLPQIAVCLVGLDTQLYNGICCKVMPAALTEGHGVPTVVALYVKSGKPCVLDV